MIRTACIPTSTLSLPIPPTPSILRKQRRWNHALQRNALADISANCDSRGLSGAVLTRCQQLLSQVPTELHNLNQGLTTLQFYSLSVSPFDSTLVQGGTQDNGTWQSTATPGLFVQYHRWRRRPVRV